jgi:hypothetical protein
LAGPHLSAVVEELPQDLRHRRKTLAMNTVGATVGGQPYCLGRQEDDRLVPGEGSVVGKHERKGGSLRIFLSMRCVDQQHAQPPSGLADQDAISVRPGVLRLHGPASQPAEGPEAVASSP